MSQYALPILFTLFIWWFSTGVILYLDGLPAHTFRWSFLSASALLALAFYGLMATRGDSTVKGAYLAFACSLLAWAWQEVSFLLGYVTGPRRSGSPAGCTPWEHFVCAIQTILYHEFALALTAGAVVALTWKAPNQVGTWTFLILWGMRLSAKLNLFLGVRNLNEKFLPAHLRYLESYFTRRRMNLLFPVSITASSVLAWLIWRGALAGYAEAFEATGLTIAGTLLTLAIFEHWLMVLPLPSEALWNWGLRSRREGLARS
jgi:putative photosynthetic complex assembly protein 2